MPQRSRSPHTPDGESRLVSVIIPFADDAAHLPRTLACLSRLDYPELEFIFINDASNDGSVGLIEDWIAAETRADTIRAEQANASPTRRNWNARCTRASECRVGVALAREHGVAQARGEWVWFCDSDDTFTPHIVSDMVAACTDTASYTDLVICRAVHIEPGGRHRLMEGFDSPTQLNRSELFTAIAGGRVRGYLWNKLFRKSVLVAAIQQIACQQIASQQPDDHRSARQQPARLSSQSDFLLVVAAAEHVNTAVCIPTVGYYYCERTASISTGSDLKIANTATCANYFVGKLIAALDSSRQAKGASEYFRTWFYRVPCFTTPTHQQWHSERKARVQQAIRKELSWSGLFLLARGVPELDLPAMPRVAVHGVAQKILGPIGLYDASYALLRRIISGAATTRGEDSRQRTPNQT